MGVGRWVTSRAEPFEGRMAARCWPEGVEVTVALSLMLLTVEDMMGGRFGCFWWEVVDGIWDDEI